VSGESSNQQARTWQAELENKQLSINGVRELYKERNSIKLIKLQNWSDVSQYDQIEG